MNHKAYRSRGTYILSGLKLCVTKYSYVKLQSLYRRTIVCISKSGLRDALIPDSEFLLNENLGAQYNVKCHVIDHP